MTLGTNTLPDGADTLAATKSHYMDSDGVGTRKMVVHFLEEERQKQRQTAAELSREEEKEFERIEKRRQAALEEQRKLNLSPRGQERLSSIHANHGSVVKSPASHNHSVCSSSKSGSRP